MINNGSHVASAFIHKIKFTELACLFENHFTVTNEDNIIIIIGYIDVDNLKNLIQWTKWNTQYRTSWKNYFVD